VVASFGTGGGRAQEKGGRLRPAEHDYTCPTRWQWFRRIFRTPCLAGRNQGGQYVFGRELPPGRGWAFFGPARVVGLRRSDRAALPWLQFTIQGSDQCAGTVSLEGRGGGHVRMGQRAGDAAVRRPCARYCTLMGVMIVSRQATWWRAFGETAVIKGDQG
jgi:hypothetical protein